MAKWIPKAMGTDDLLTELNNMAAFWHGVFMVEVDEHPERDHAHTWRVLDDIEDLLDGAHDRAEAEEVWSSMMMSIREVSDGIAVLYARLHKASVEGKLTATELYGKGVTPEEYEIPPEYDGTPEIRYVNHVECASVSNLYGGIPGIGTVSFSNDDDLHFGIQIPKADLREWAVGTRFQVVMLEAPHEG